MSRALGVALLGLSALDCNRESARRPTFVAPQAMAVDKKPSVAAEPALLVCEADGSACAPSKAGAQISGRKLLRLERGVSDFELDAATHVEVAPSSVLLLEDAPRALTVRAGGVVLSRSARAELGPLVVKLVDRELELVGHAALIAQLDDDNHAQVFVTRGSVKVKEPSGTRELHAGEGALFERQAAADWQAVFSGKVSHFRSTVLAMAQPAP